MAKTDTAPTYKGGEFIRAASGGDRDILMVLLNPGQQYTEAQVAELVQSYLAREAVR